MLDEVADDPRYSEPGCGVAYGQKLKTGGRPRTSCRELTGDNVSVLEDAVGLSLLTDVAG